MDSTTQDILGLTPTEVDSLLYLANTKCATPNAKNGKKPRLSKKPKTAKKKHTTSSDESTTAELASPSKASKSADEAPSTSNKPAPARIPRIEIHHRIDKVTRCLLEPTRRTLPAQPVYPSYLAFDADSFALNRKKFLENAVIAAESIFDDAMAHYVDNSSAIDFSAYFQVTMTNPNENVLKRTANYNHQISNSIVTDAKSNTPMLYSTAVDNNYATLKSYNKPTTTLTNQSSRTTEVSSLHDIRYGSSRIQEKNVVPVGILTANIRPVIPLPVVDTSMPSRSNPNYSAQPPPVVHPFGSQFIPNWSYGSSPANSSISRPAVYPFGSHINPAGSYFSPSSNSAFSMPADRSFGYQNIPANSMSADRPFVSQINPAGSYVSSPANSAFSMPADRPAEIRHPTDQYRSMHTNPSEMSYPSDPTDVSEHINMADFTRKRSRSAMQHQPAKCAFQ